MAYKRSDWNALINEVNSVLQSPPPDTDCEPVNELPEVGPNHRWAKSDIRAVQEAISSTCPDIEWEEIDDLWKQSTLDEITDNLGQAWCDCEPDEECDDQEGDGATFTLFSTAPVRVMSQCFGDDPDASMDLCSVINGLQVGPSGISGRVWRVRIHRTYNDGHQNQSFWANGTINCDGTANCTTAIDSPTNPGAPFIFCSGGPEGECCTNESFPVSVALAQQQIDDFPETVFEFSYVLEVDNLSAVCNPECE